MKARDETEVKARKKVREREEKYNEIKEECVEGK